MFAAYRRGIVALVYCTMVTIHLPDKLTYSIGGSVSVYSHRICVDSDRLTMSPKVGPLDPMQRPARTLCDHAKVLCSCLFSHPKRRLCYPPIRISSTLNSMTMTNRIRRPNALSTSYMSPTFLCLAPSLRLQQNQTRIFFDIILLLIHV